MKILTKRIAFLQNIVLIFHGFSVFCYHRICYLACVILKVRFIASK